MTALYVSSHNQPKVCGNCQLSTERPVVGGSSKCDVTRCIQCGAETHIVDYHIFSLGENCDKLHHEYFGKLVAAA